METPEEKHTVELNLMRRHWEVKLNTRHRKHKECKIN